MKPAEAYHLACKCLIVDDHPEIVNDIKEKFIAGEIDLSKFIRLCSNHLVLPVVTLNLTKIGLLNHFPNDLVDHLMEILQLNRERNCQILQQIEEINDALVTAKIQPVYLKGAANIMDNLYSDIGERMLGDIDLLVRDEVYLKTAEIVKNLGYKTDSAFYDDVTLLKDYPRLFRDDVPADIEIHRVPVEITFSRQFSTDLIFKNKTAVANKRNCFVSSDEHKITQTFIHSQLSNHGYQFKQIGLRDLYDFHLLSKRVNLTEVIDTIEEKEKAQFFSDYVQYFMSPVCIEGLLNNKKTKKIITWNIWFLNHPRIHYFYIKTLKLHYLIFKRYIGRILKAFFQKSSFTFIYNRLKDPSWYKKHFEDVRDRF